MSNKMSGQGGADGLRRRADSAPDVPPFSLDAPRYTQDTFSGRLRHFLDMTDPRTLFVGKDELRRSLSMLEEFKKTKQLPSGACDADMWRARKIKESTVHPDTGETIFAPFRMSGFVPFGSITVIGMLLPNQTPLSTVFWQWANQRYRHRCTLCLLFVAGPAPLLR